MHTLPAAPPWRSLPLPAQESGSPHCLSPEVSSVVCLLFIISRTGLILRFCLFIGVNSWKKGNLWLINGQITIMQIKKNLYFHLKLCESSSRIFTNMVSKLFREMVSQRPNLRAFRAAVFLFVRKLRPLILLHFWPTRNDPLLQTKAGYLQQAAMLLGENCRVNFPQPPRSWTAG